LVVKGRAIRLLALWAVRPVQSLSACTRVYFTFTVIGERSNHQCLVRGTISRRLTSVMQGT
jgi:hypothetical protein